VVSAADPLRPLILLATPGQKSARTLYPTHTSHQSTDHITLITLITLMAFRDTNEAQVYSKCSFLRPRSILVKFVYSS
jgi:hypothetical protein